MLCRWTPAAAADLDNINAYLRTRHPQYRENHDSPSLRGRTVAKAIADARRIGRIDNTRELFVRLCRM